MIVLSLFDGISCARLALEKANIPIKEYYTSEIDKYAIKVSQTNYPTNIQLGNVKEVKPFQVDLLIGGSPCQDLSVAKKNRKGLEGDRSSLFWEYVRLLKECKPKYFIFENVASMPDDARDTISKALNVGPIMINASLVSAQRRRRFFWTNIPNVELPNDRGILVKDILQQEVDEKYYINYSVEEKKGQAFRVYPTEGKSVTLTANGGRVGAKTGLYVVSMIGRKMKDGKRCDNDPDATYKQKVGIKIDQEKTGTLTTIQKDNLILNDKRIRRLTPIECERLQGVPENYTSCVSDTQRYKCLGNAFNVDVVAHILSYIPKE